MLMFFSLFGLASGQWINFYSSEMDQTKPFLISKTYYDSEDGGEKVFHTLEQAYAAFNDDSEFSLVLRVCSKNPLPVVFTGEFHNPSYIAYLINARFSPDFIGNGGIKLDRVFLLTTGNDCSGIWKNIHTEYWLIPKNSDFPEFAEIGNIADYCDSFKLNSAKYERKILVESFKLNKEMLTSEKFSKDDFLTPSTEFAFKQNLLELLQKDRFSYVLLEYPDFSKSKKVIFSQALRLKQFLVKDHIRTARIVVNPCKTASGECDFESKSRYPIYPNVTLIRHK